MTALYRATTRHLTSPARTPLPWTQLIIVDKRAPDETYVHIAVYSM
ncbi:hypothetical protein BJN37_23835 [Mycobacterium avium subsp. hominissuis]|nr:hypothetical protein [Mycobacterium avium]